MFSYYGAEYIAFIYVGEEENNICRDCLKEGPEAIKQKVLKRAREIREGIRPKVKAADFLEEFGSGLENTDPSHLVYSEDAQEKISKCAN